MLDNILTKRDAVAEYGNDAQKAHFEKYGKFTSKRYEEALIKSINSWHDKDTEVVNNPNGRGKVYKVGNKLVEQKQIESGNISNGNWSIYTKNLDTKVVAVLELGINEKDAQTLSRWALDFGIITKEQHDLLASRHHEGLRQSYINDSLKKGVIKSGEGRVLDDYTASIREVIDSLAGALNRMTKLGIIEMNKVYNGHTLENENIEIHYSTYGKVLDIKRELQEYFNVDEWYLANYKNAKKSIQYNEILSERIAMVRDEGGNVLGLTNTYVTYFIKLKARKMRILKYLEKYNPDAIKLYNENKEKFLNDNFNEFCENRITHIKNETQKKVDNFLKPRATNKKLIDELGGKEKKRIPTIEDYGYDSEYYQLYFEEDRNLVALMIELENRYGYKFKNTQDVA